MAGPSTSLKSGEYLMIIKFVFKYLGIIRILKEINRD